MDLGKVCSEAEGLLAFLQSDKTADLDQFVYLELKSIPVLTIHNPVL